jgi:hypothetical protein
MRDLVWENDLLAYYNVGPLYTYELLLIFLLWVALKTIIDNVLAVMGLYKMVSREEALVEWSRIERILS